MDSVTTTLDLRELGCGQGHTLVFQCLGFMEPGQSLGVINDHGLDKLKRQIALRFDGKVDWAEEKISDDEYRATIGVLSR